MRSRAVLMPFLLVALSARLNAESWVAHVDTIFPPTGISAGAGGVTVFTTGEMFQALDGAEPRSRSFSVPADSALQIEHVTAARQGFIAAGLYIEATPARTGRPAVIRLDGRGRVQWARAIEAGSLRHATYAVESSDGDILVATRLEQAMMLLRLSATGELKWARSLDRTDVQPIRALIATRDGGALVVSFALTRAAALTRVSPAGDVMWDRVLGTADSGFGLYDAVELADGGFICVGRARTYSTDNRDGVLVRISAKGEVVWQKLLGGDGEDGLYSVTRVSGDEFAAAGGTTSAGTGDADTWLVAFTADGIVRKEVAVGNADENDGPTDPHRAYVASADGDAVVASPAGLRLLAARLREATSACSATRAVSTRVTDAKASHRETVLEVTAVTPAIQAISVSLSDGGTVRRRKACSWSGAAPAPARAHKIAVEPPAEEELFAADVARLLIERKFERLDSLAAELRSGRLTFESGGSKLRAFYEALARHSTLAALGDEGHRRLFSEWGAGTRSTTSRIAGASHEYAIAYRVRGSGFFSSLRPADVETYRRLIDGVLGSLQTVEQSGECDAPCFELQIRAATLGGWSEPLEKLLKVDPRYWEAFAPAAFYLDENWGGRPGDVHRFIDSAAARTREALGDAIYALHYAGWTFGVISVEPASRTPDPDWPRMRKGFSDFLRLYPRSRRAAHQFAAAAYRVARDRVAARALFQSPLLEWRSGLAVWVDRPEYDRAKVWALAEPVSPFISSIAAGRLPPERLVAPAVVRFADGTTHDVRVFLTATRRGAVGVTVRGSSWADDSPVVTSWVVDGREVVPGDEIPGRPRERWATFTPTAGVLAQLHLLKVRATPVAAGDRMYIIADEVIPVRVTAASGSFWPVADRPLVPEKLAGAPVLDDTGAVAGVLLPSAAPHHAPQAGELLAILPKE